MIRMSRNVHTAPSPEATSTFLGTEYRVLLTAEDTNDAIGAVELIVQPGAGAPLHTNTREALLWFVIDGTVTLQTEDEGQIEVAPGYASFLPQGSTHTFVNNTEQPVRALLVCIPGGFERFFLDLSGKLPAGVPKAAPPEEAVATLVATAERYGQKVHLEG